MRSRGGSVTWPSRRDGSPATPPSSRSTSGGESPSLHAARRRGCRAESGRGVGRGVGAWPGSGEGIDSLCPRQRRRTEGLKHKVAHRGWSGRRQPYSNGTHAIPAASRPRSVNRARRSPSHARDQQRQMLTNLDWFAQAAVRNTPEGCKRRHLIVARDEFRRRARRLLAIAIVDQLMAAHFGHSHVEHEGAWVPWCSGGRETLRPTGTARPLSPAPAARVRGTRAVRRDRR